jgi:hypothetical protein
MFDWRDPYSQTLLGTRYIYILSSSIKIYLEKVYSLNLDVVQCSILIFTLVKKSG